MTDPTPIGSTTRVQIQALVVDPNIRKNVKVTPSFMQSVKQHGVLEPVDAYQDDQGIWHLQDGQLRYLASLDNGLPDIPVLAQDPALAEAAKVIKQLIKNEHRAELTEADRAGAYQTLFEMGVSADAIARKANQPKKSIEKALAVVASPAGAEALEVGIPLDRAAIITEFVDSPDVVASLTSTAVEEPDRFNYRVEAARRGREQAALKQAVIDELTAAGIPVAEQGDAFNTAIPLDRVYLDEKLTQPATVDDIKEQGILLALVRQSQTYRDGAWQDIYVPEYYVTEPAERGFHYRQNTATGKEPLTEKQRDERKATRDNNKAWPIATAVRLEWIKTELLQRTSLPSDVDQFVAISMANGHPRDSYGSGLSLARDWLDLRAGSYYSDELVLAAEKKPGTALKIALAIAIGNVEQKISDREGWRDNSGEPQKISRYLSKLASWGYPLSDIEGSLLVKAKSVSK